MCHLSWESLEVVADHFSTTLQAAGYEASKVKREWKNLKILQKTFYQGVETRELWEKILQYRQKEYPNLCMLVDVVMAIGVSNSTVEILECGFSILSCHLLT